MRTAFIATLFELAKADARIVLIVGDLGFGVVTEFADTLPNQFVNAGVAEQNMTGLAAGMALSGKIVFTYSIANFPVMRCLEQIRNDVCYHNASVKIVAVGGGLAYGALGASHHATEDIAVMRAMPNMHVLAPGDPLEAELAVRSIVKQPGPAYLRLGRAGEPIVHSQSPEFVVGQPIRVRRGADAVLVSTGGLLANSVSASELLRDSGIEAGVLSMPTVKPIDVEALMSELSGTPAIFTVEEHSVVGGLGSAIAEVLMESPRPHPLYKRIGLASAFTSVVGNQEYLRQHHGLDPTGIARTVLHTLRHRPA